MTPFRGWMSLNTRSTAFIVPPAVAETSNLDTIAWPLMAMETQF